MSGSLSEGTGWKSEVEVGAESLVVGRKLIGSRAEWTVGFKILVFFENDLVEGHTFRFDLKGRTHETR